MMPVTPKPTDIASESIAAMSPTSSELARNQRTVSALKSSDVRARSPVRASIRAAKSLADTPDVALTRTKVSRRRSGNKIREALEYVVARSSAGPLISLQLRCLQLALGSSRVGNHRIGSTQYGSRYAVLERWKPGQRGVIYSDHLEGLKLAVWKPHLRRSQSHRNGGVDPLDTAYTVERGGRYIGGFLDRLHGRVHDPNVDHRVLAHEREAARHKAGEIRRGKCDQEGRESDAEH